MQRTLICPKNVLNTNLDGKTYIVTVGYSGIGLATTEHLAKQGAKIIIGCRRPSEGEKAKSLIQEKNPSAQIDILEIDLGSLNSIRNFVQNFLSIYDRLHGLVNNAGVIHTPFGKTKDGFETQFGTNHLGHFLPTELLLPSIQQSSPSRIVILSSCFHDKAMGKEGKINLDDLNLEPWEGKN